MNRPDNRTMEKRLDHILDQTGSALIILGGITIMLTVVMEVLLRYVFKKPLFGLEEFSCLVAIWVYFLGAIFGTKYDSHVQGDVAVRFFPGERQQAVVKVLVWTLSLMACLLFLYHSVKYAIWLYGTGERTTGLWWPRIISVASMPFGAFFMSLFSLVNIFKYFGQAGKPPEVVQGRNI